MHRLCHSVNLLHASLLEGKVCKEMPGRDMVTCKEHYNNRDINIHEDAKKGYRMRDDIGKQWPILYSTILTVHTHGAFV